MKKARRDFSLALILCAVMVLFNSYFAIKPPTGFGPSVAGLSTLVQHKAWADVTYVLPGAVLGGHVGKIVVYQSDQMARLEGFFGEQAIINFISTSAVEDLFPLDTPSLRYYSFSRVLSAPCNDLVGSEAQVSGRCKLTVVVPRNRSHKAGVIEYVVWLEETSVTVLDTRVLELDRIARFKESIR